MKCLGESSWCWREKVNEKNSKFFILTGLPDSLKVIAWQKKMLPMKKGGFRLMDSEMQKGWF